ncbi:hypothetical protein HPB51_002125 [Rhipicephalus microplus]|uniref:Carbohydrate sulfotransferase n=1 Tax=Rhipicephalus microplus TaxID=6941 RepID=A0A9J6EPZ5_RHIMP|nr:hypothetical protein HPB51_002125 [Rhipicephalus microplus]
MADKSFEAENMKNASVQNVVFVFLLHEATAAVVWKVGPTFHEATAAVVWKVSGCSHVLTGFEWRRLPFPEVSPLKKPSVGPGYACAHLENRWVTGGNAGLNPRPPAAEADTQPRGHGCGSSAGATTRVLCAPYRFTIQIPDGASVFENREIGKVPSTSLKSLFASLLRINATPGKRDDDALHSSFNERVFRIGPTHWPLSKLRQYTRVSVLFVWHPFERLVSAFEDKAGKPRDRERFFYEVYWDHMLAGNNGSSNSDATTTSTRAITFPQFVDYLLRVPVSQWDDHWAPYYSRCEPCLFRYNFVGHLATAVRDMALLWRRMGLKIPP